MAASTLNRLASVNSNSSRPWRRTALSHHFGRRQPSNPQPLPARAPPPPRLEPFHEVLTMTWRVVIPRSTRACVITTRGANTSTHKPPLPQGWSAWRNAAAAVAAAGAAPRTVSEAAPVPGTDTAADTIPGTGAAAGATAAAGAEWSGLLVSRGSRGHAGVQAARPRPRAWRPVSQCIPSVSSPSQLGKRGKTTDMPAQPAGRPRGEQAPKVPTPGLQRGAWYQPAACRSHAASMGVAP